MTNHDAELNMEYHHGGQQQAKYEPSSFSNQFINTVGPDLSIPGQCDGGQSADGYQGWKEDTHPPLYGQDQLHDGFGPVYATPSYPSPQSPDHSAGGYQDWQQNTQPPLYGQNQLQGGYGPVYATPSFPSQPHAHGQGMGHQHGIGGMQWQHGCMCRHPQPVMPYYMQQPMGHQPYQ